MKLHRHQSCSYYLVHFKHKFVLFATISFFIIRKSGNKTTFYCTTFFHFCSQKIINSVDWISVLYFAFMGLLYWLDRNYIIIQTYKITHSSELSPSMVHIFGKISFYVRWALLGGTYVNSYFLKFKHLLSCWNGVSFNQPLSKTTFVHTRRNKLIFEKFFFHFLKILIK